MQTQSQLCWPWQVPPDFFSLNWQYIALKVKQQSCNIHVYLSYLQSKNFDAGQVGQASFPLITEVNKIMRIVVWFTGTWNLLGWWHGSEYWCCLVESAPTGGCCNMWRYESGQRWSQRYLNYQKEAPDHSLPDFITDAFDVVTWQFSLTAIANTFGFVAVT